MLQISIGLGLLSACAANLPGTPTTYLTSTQGGISTADLATEQSLTSTQVNFDLNDLFSNINPNTSSKNCPGDAFNFYNPFTGALNPLLTSATLPDGSAAPAQPAFITNVAVDITDANQAASLTMECAEFPGATPQVPPSACATMGNAGDYAAIPYYTMLDDQCAGIGPIDSPDPQVAKLLAGGVYFNLDRAQLGPHENLLLNVTYFPMSPNNKYPSGTQLTFADQAFFKVHLKQTGESMSFLESILQPRFITFEGYTTTYPTIVDTLDIMAPPSSHMRTDQLMIPLSVNSSIDQIRIERYSGTGIIVSASLYRMGYR